MALAGLGIVLRVVQYLSDRSLWLDEALLALNLIKRPPSELLGTLDFNQAAPPAFLLLERGVGEIFGYSEFALRAIPLLAGIGSVAAFAWLARRLLKPLAALLAVLLFSLADGLIYYASEVKPYSLDVFATVLLLAGAVLLAEAPTRKTAAAVGVGGALLMTLSYAAVLLAASIGLSFLLAATRERRATNVARSIPLVVWAIFAIAAYTSASAGGIRSAFETGPRPSGSTVARLGDLLHQVNILGTDLLGTIGFLDGLPWNQLFKLASVTFAIGAIALARRRPLQALLFLTPIALVLFAWAIGQYPLVPRTTLFLVPGVILLLAHGVGATAAWIPSSRAAALTTLMTLGLLIGPVWTAGKALAQPRAHEELEPVLDYVKSNWQPGDTLYVHYAAQYALLYYSECDCRADDDSWRFTGLRGRDQFAPALVPVSANLVVVPRASGARQLADLVRLRAGQRVWFLYTHVQGNAEKAFIRRRLIGGLDETGKRLAGIDRIGAHAYLYRIDPS